MEFATSSDQTLDGVLYLSVAFFIASFGALLLCLLMRHRRLHNQAHAERVETEWRHFCFQALMNDLPDTLPSMKQRDLTDVVEIWLHTFDRVRGADAAKGLVKLGESLNFSERLLPLLKSGDMDEKLLAIMALGQLKERRALPVIRQSLDNSYPLLSLAAMKAYMEIAPEEGLPELMQRIDTPGWPLGRVRHLLHSVPRHLQTHYLSIAAETLSRHQLPHLLVLIFALAPSESSQVAQHCLSRFPDCSRLKITVLKHTADPRFLPLARTCCTSDLPELRSESLLALGRLGDREEEARLLHHLDNDTWLSQQSAARSLITHIHDISAAHAILFRLQSASALQHWSELLFERGWLPEPEPALPAADDPSLPARVATHV